MSSPVISDLAKSLPKETITALLSKVSGETERRQRAQEMSADLRSSFRKFVPAAWNVVEPSRPLTSAWYIDAIAEHLQAVADGKIQNLLINVPPGSGKSMLCSVMFPAWMWTHRPGWRSTFASYDSGLSTRDSVRCRDLLESVWYRETFKPDWKLSTDQNEKTYYVNTAKGFRVSTSVGGRGTGWRSNCTLIDDPINVTDQFSDAVLEKCVLWYDQTIYNRLISMQLDSRIIIMQRVGDRDLSGHVLRLGGWEHLMVPMLFDPSRSRVTSIGWSDPRKNNGDLMSPVLFPQSVVDDTKKTLGQSAWAGQYQQFPAPDGGGILKSHCWNYWQPSTMDLPPVRVKRPDGTIEERKAVSLPTSFDLSLQAWDMAFKDLETSDYVVGLVVSTRGANRYIRKQVRGKMDLPASVAAVRQLTGDAPEAHLKLIEDKANGPAVIQSLQNEIPGLVAVNPEGGKVSRAAGASPELESGNWFLPHPMIAPWVGNPENPTESGFLAETVMFPFGANDDQCFAAGTPIATPRGDVPIERLRAGDSVITPFGVRMVVGCGCTGIRATIQYAGLEVTPNHPIFAHGDGFIAVDSLSQGAVFDRLSACGLIRWKCLKLLTSMELNTGSWGRDAITSASLRGMKSESVPRDCMLLFTRLIAERKFRKASRFITKITTLSITTLTIWSRYYVGHIADCIRSKIQKSSSLIWSGSGRLRKNGTDPKRVELGIESTAKMVGWEEPQASALVCGVSEHSRHSTRPNTAVTSAATITEDPSGSTTIFGLVLSAEQTLRSPSRSTLPKPERHAASHARLLSSRKPVYNLSVDQDGAYYANGILVSNCDAWSMAAIRIQKEQVGGVFGVSESDIRVEPFDLKLIEKWAKIYGLSVTWREVASVWICREPLTSQHYLYAEYSAPASDPAQHAAAVRLLGDHQGYMTSKDVGRDIKDGYAVATKYRSLGLKLETTQNNEDAMLIDLAEALRTGKLKVFAHCQKFFDQYRMARRDDAGHLPKDNRGTIDAVMVAWNARTKMREPVDPNKKPANSRMSRSDVGGNGWMTS